MQENELKTIAMAYAEDDVFAVGGHKNSTELAGTYGLDIVVDEAFKTADTEFSGLLQKVRTAAPDAFLFWGTGAAPVIMTKAFADSGIDSQLVLTGAQASTLYTEAAGAAANGVVLNGYAAVVGDSLPDGELKSQYDRLKEAVHKEYSQGVSQFNSDAYSAAMITMEAMKNADELTREGVRNALEATDLTTANGYYKWSAENHNNTDLNNIAVFEVQDTKFRPTEWQMSRFAQ
jgi:branched-chain amino acid transport system substrate-binding protein